MKKFILIITLAAAFFTAGLQAEDVYEGWLWTGTGWVNTNSGGGDPIPPPPPPKG